MANKRRKGFSLGTRLAMIATLLVLGGCVLTFVFVTSDLRSPNLKPEDVLNAINRAVTVPTSSPAPVPQASIKTTTVTIAPTQQTQAMATNAPTFRSLTVTVAGEIAFETDIADTLKNAKDGYSAEALLSGIAGEIDGDLRIASLANVLYADVKSSSDVNADPALLSAARAAGFNYLLPANENALNYGADGVRATLSAIKAAGFTAAGLYGEAALSGGMSMTTAGDMRVAVLQYVMPALFKSNIQKLPEYAYAMIPYSAERAAQDIASARLNGANIVIVSIHWGKKGATKPTEEQTNIAKELVANGANLIIGAHSSAVQPVAYVTVDDESGVRKQGLVAYSMGTLLEESRDENAARSGMLLHVQMLLNNQTGDVTFAEVAYTPTYTWKQDGQFRVLPSARSAPQNMTEKQISVMGNSLELIQSVMENSPASQRIP